MANVETQVFSETEFISGIPFQRACSTLLQVTLLAFFAENSRFSASNGSRFMLLNYVALGSPKQYQTVQFGLSEPPSGYHSVHGVRSTDSAKTDFRDDEFVIFNTNQQKQGFLLEFETVPVSSADKPLAQGSCEVL